ncbi:glycoside hydrolase family protein [Anaerosporobacter faecicola]|uniref:glycoside hydrolase family protein n=1 Tax=Anaerosporobacter faecicola TaxID=2718714 RepID=UPI001438B19E|nr:glycoside hydrolase family protein [Anaerosporobacter faecicola]
MKISNRGLDLIKQFEGCRLKAYRCPAGVLTIGYGHTRGVYEGQTITNVQATTYLKNDVIKFERAVNDLVKVRITQNMFDSLVSFVYNLGPGALKNSTLLKLLNCEDYVKSSLEFAKWNKAGGKVLSGLVKRRSLEKKLFIEDMYLVPDKKVNKKSCKLEIMWLQTKLNEVSNANLVVDGIYGEMTRQAVLDYWTSLGWNKESKSDGWTVGEKTINKLCV